MKRILLLAIAALFCMTLFAAPASAELKFGVRQYLFQNMPLPTEQTMGAYFGVPASPQFDVIFGLDYWHYKLSTDVWVDRAAGVSANAEVGGGTLLLHGGARFYLQPQVTGTVSPYVQGEVFYGFGSASTQPNLPDSLLDPVKDLLSPYGFTAAFGAEYFASDNFGIGGEVGIRYAVTKASSNDPVVDVSGFLPKTASSGPLDTKFTSMTIYSGLSINFKF